MSDDKVNGIVNEIAKVEGKIEEVIAELSEYIERGETVNSELLIYISNQLMEQTESLASISTDFAKNSGSLSKGRITANLMAHEDDLRNNHNRITFKNAQSFQYSEETPVRH